MADLTMCRGEDCPDKEKCYRFTAPINEYRQEVFTDTPNQPCYFYLANDNKPDGRKIGKWWKNKEG